jgi:hypothetical protein
MNKIILALFCLTLATTAALAKDFHLEATQLRGAHTSGSPPQLPVVFVLLFPIENGEVRPMVYESFGSEDMQVDIRALVKHGDIPPGSTLHFNPTPDLKHPTDAQIQAFKDFCKKLGITFVVDETA